MKDKNDTVSGKSLTELLDQTRKERDDALRFAGEAHKQRNQALECLGETAIQRDDAQAKLRESEAKCADMAAILNDASHSVYCRDEKERVRLKLPKCPACRWKALQHRLEKVTKRTE